LFIFRLVELAGVRLIDRSSKSLLQEPKHLRCELPKALQALTLQLLVVIYLALVCTFLICGLMTNSNNDAATKLITIVVITCLLVMVGL